MKLLTLFLLILTASAFADMPCVDEKEGLWLQPVSDLESPGFPVGAEAVSQPKWYEKDPLIQDYLGQGNDFFISNFEGTLTGPSGNLNGGTEGDCIEIFYTLTIKYQVEIISSKTKKYDIYGNEETITEIIKVWKYRRVSFSYEDFCPCE